jgi:hypothetical protein
MASLIQEADLRSNTAASFDSDVSSGNAVLVSIMTLDTTTTVSSVTDNQSNTYTAVPSGTDLLMSHPAGGGNGARGHFFYCANITNQPKTVHVTLSTTPPDISYIQIYEVSGLGSTITVDDVQTSGTASFTASPSLAFTADAPGFAIAMIGVNGIQSFTPGSGWTTSYSDSGAANFMHRVIESAGGYTANATLGAAQSCNVAVVLFSDAGGGGPPIQSLLATITRNIPG